MSRWSLFAITLFVVVLMAGAFFVLRGPDGAGTKQAPNFVLPDLEGQVVRMEDLRGQVIVLNIWATWCPPCIEEMPTLQELAQKMKDEDLVVLAVSQDEEPEKVKPWVEKHDLTFPVLLDPRAEVGYRYGVTGYPETFVVDREGRIVHHHVGFRDWSEPEVVAALDRLLETGEWQLTSGSRSSRRVPTG